MVKDTFQMLWYLFLVYCIIFTLISGYFKLFPKVDQEQIQLQQDLTRAMKASNICQDPVVQRIMGAK